ncbi:ATP-binding protein [Methanobacterium formicicum]|uniref:ATPase AAA n=1 Tax=Methanobacterium formicicum TaxID=2162 RepID=A0A0S4FNX6_METFO|nr:DUF499 domain-containing protein [Methanobacterium formicicum]CEL24789.1 hypothetical protein MB9_1151 [Methanobacterium formicicum]
MKPFPTVAVPHKDIIEDRLTMDVFAANLWEVFKGRAPDEYQDPETFFKKTYQTQGLKNIIDITQKRLGGEGGDPVIQLQTPFGGGKTHTLIALYHKAKEMGAKTVVISGTALDPKDITIWEEMEGQLTGKVEKLEGNTSPGHEKIRSLLDDNQPVLILIDELLEYATKAAGVKVEGSNLASQLLAFMQELGEAVSTVAKAQVIVTLPSSHMEHFDEAAEALFTQLQKVFGRLEKIYTPVEDDEIYPVIRSRLFSTVDERDSSKIVNQFMDYAELENILPDNIDKSDYKHKFLKSYPFQPEVIDVLYKRWGSFPSFQRTRGVLRLLSLVVNSLKDSKNPIIRLSDFDLGYDEIKRELINFAGPEFDSIIASDITSSESGSKETDKKLGAAYLSYSFGTKISTTIFMYSFSGSQSGKHGASIREIKMSCADVDIPSAIISDAIGFLNDTLLYLHSRDGRYFIHREPNPKKAFISKKEGIKDEVVTNAEEDLLGSILGRKIFEVYKWPKRTNDIPDTKKLKLIVGKDPDRFEEFLESYGERPRIYKNTMIFLAPFESERHVFDDHVRGKIAWDLVLKDPLINLNQDQKKEIKEKVKNAEKDSKEYIRNLYRIVYVPTRDGLKDIDLGRHPYGMSTSVDNEIKERLKIDDELSDILAPLLIQKKYLSGKNYVETKNILDSFYKTPGEDRITSDNVLKTSIIEGVKQELFGLGVLTDGEIKCQKFGEKCTPYLQEEEIIIDSGICSQPQCPELTISFIKNQHLKLGEYVKTKEIFESLLKDCKEEEATNKLISAIKKGVQEGSFGIGQLVDGKPECQLFEEECYPTLLNSEIITRADLCKEETGDIKQYTTSSFKIKNLYLKDRDYITTKSIFKSELKDYDDKEVCSKLKDALVNGVKEGLFGLGDLNNGEPDCAFFKENSTPELYINEIIINPSICDGDSDVYKNIELEFEVPVDKVPDIIRMINFLKEPFDEVNAKTNFKITARNGDMPITDFERIKETFDQLNVKIIKEMKK